jgi:(1->4)-alpha-D-glucan 1-alpha-D-glucosylmutase
VPRLVAALTPDETLPLGTAWGDSSVAVPPGRWRNVLTGDALEIDRDGAAAADLFSVLPFCVLRAQP